MLVFFFIHFTQVYIFFGLSSFMVDSFGLLEYFGTCIVTNDSFTFLVFLPQVTPSLVGRNGKPVFGPRVDPGAARDE